MKISSTITNPVADAKKLFEKELRKSTFKLLAMLGQMGEDIKFESPIVITKASVDFRSRVTTNTIVTNMVSYIPPYDDESGYYLLYGSDNRVPLVGDHELSLTDRINVYEELKSMVRKR
jgi:hypothetical protein